MLSEREKMIALLDQVYGARKEGTGIEYKRYSNEKIADELGADSGQFSRTLNPPIGKERSEESHRRYNTRLELILSNKRKSTQIKWLGGILLASIIAMVSWSIFSPSRDIQIPIQSSLNLTSSSCCYVIETVEQADKFLELSSDLNGYQMLYQALLLKHMMDNRSDLSGEERTFFTKQRIKEIVESTIKGNRLRYRDMGFITTDGKGISDLIEEIQPMAHNLKGADEIVPLLVNQDIPLEEMADLIRGKIRGVQKEYWPKYLEAFAAIKGDTVATFLSH